MFVVATAGHVDHGKSTLVRALTGMEPDRWAEERRRGLTIDLGFAWTTLPSGADVAFVDVPGHERFLGNMLAGLGPTPVVCFIVAADEGWQAQSSDHRDAVAALGIAHGLIVITKADRAPERVNDVVAQVRTELASTGLDAAPVVVTSAATGAGLEGLRAALDALLVTLPPADAGARVRFWIDRAFTITGAGTVVTGTLGGGTLRPEDALQLVSPDHETRVVVRGMQQLGRAVSIARPTARLALNLRGVPADEVARGDVLLTPGAWLPTAIIDVARTSGAACDEVPEQLIAHVGTAAVPVHVRPFGATHARLRLDRALPLVPGDRLVLRDPSSRRVLAGVIVVDADPPVLRRRGAAAARGEQLRAVGDRIDLAGEVQRRGAVRREHLFALGLINDDTPAPAGVDPIGEWWVDSAHVDEWSNRLQAAVANAVERDPLSPGLSTGAAQTSLGLPDRSLLPLVVGRAGLQIDGGHVVAAGGVGNIGPLEGALRILVDRLRETPFTAPEADELTELGLGVRELAAAERVGRILRLDAGVVVLPTTPALAMRSLSALPQPFTTSEARQALGSTRRTVIPLLEHLDRRGWTRRVDSTHREIVRSS